MKKSIFPKLNEVGALYEPWPKNSKIESSNETYEGLTLSEKDPPIEYILRFVSAVFQHAIITNTMPLTPNDLAKSVDRESLSYPEYVNALKANGIDTEKLHELAQNISNSYEQSLFDRKVKAAKFFELIKTEWLIGDAEVRELIDGESIIDLLELVLAHADTTRARIKAVKRHAENHEMKAKVFEWCDENMPRFKSMDDAAFDIAGTFIPQKFRTVREWMTEWKKLRSASTP